MTIEQIDQYLGAFYGVVYCNTCPSRPKPKMLIKIHNGYDSQGGRELNETERGQIYDSAKAHDQQHPDHRVRIIFGHYDRKGL